MTKNPVIYQAKNGAIELKSDSDNDTFWATRMQMSEIFGVNPQAISKHLGNIYKDGELVKKSTSSKMELVQNESGRKVMRQVDFYNLDAIISVGYRVNSKQATQFRIWATKTLKQHITQGYTINKSRIEQNYQAFMSAVNNVKLLAKNNIDSDDVLELIKSFANTWFSLESFDENKLPKQGLNKTQIDLQSSDLYHSVAKFKTELMAKKQATVLFAQEKKKDALAGIFANIFQSIFGEDAYPSIEEKAAHLLYFIIKNHPFNDGNKRTGAFSFIWFLQQSGFNYQSKITPQTLTTLTLLIAISDPSEKDKLIGLVLLLLSKENATN
jgi:death-on-curing family protein